MRNDQRNAPMREKVPRKERAAPAAAAYDTIAPRKGLFDAPPLG